VGDGVNYLLAVEVGVGVLVLLVRLKKLVDKVTAR